VEVSQGVPLEVVAGMQSFSAVGAVQPWGFNVKAPDGPRNTYGFRVTGDLLPTLGIRPLLGRIFTADDETRPVVILAYDYWRRTSGDPSILGRTLNIGDEQRAVVGVLQPDFHISVRDANLLIPDRRLTDGRTIARLKPGVTAAQAQGELESMARAAGVRQRDLPRVTPAADAFRPGESATVLLFQAAVALVLLITCANVANLLLVRAAARRREFAIRAAIGAGRAQLIGQSLVESLVMALAGGAAGLAIAYWILQVLNTQLPANIARHLRGADPLTIDGRVILFSLAASVFTVLIFGIAPALSALRFDLVSSLKDGAKGAAPERQRYGRLLVIAEISLALMLLVAAGLTLKSLAGLESRHLGFSAGHVLRVMIDLPRNRYADPQRRQAAMAEIMRRVKSIPGVQTAGLVGPQLFPFGGPRVRGAVFAIQGKDGVEARGEVYYASPAYFRSVQIPVLRGRGFTEQDTASAPLVALISETVARRYWGEDDPVGRVIMPSAERGGSEWVTIAGVVGDVRNPVGNDVQPTIYRPLAQTDASGGTLMVRVAGDPMSVAETVRREMRAVTPDAPEFRTADLAREVARYINPQRFSTSIFGIFAVLGLFLATVGVYGVMRTWVAMRVSEIGLRVALGAGRRDVLRLVLGQCARAAAWGVGAGLLGVAGLQRVMVSQLYGVSPADPQVLAAVTALVSAVAVGAALAPALWASRIGPADALRHE
jgi:predicted permease